MFGDSFHSPSWRLVLLTGLLAPFAVLWGVHCGQTGGAVTLVCLSLPILLVSLMGHGSWAVVACGIGASGILTEAFLSGGPQGAPGLPFATILISVLMGLCGMVMCVIRASRIEPGNDELTSDSAILRYADLKQGLKPKRQPPKSSSQPTASPSNDAAVQFYVLLETLEDIGRLISMNLDLDTLVPAILSTAKSSLRCGDCRLYLWNASREDLTNPLEASDPTPQAFVPDPHDGIGAWVIRERRVWTPDSLPPVSWNEASPDESTLPAAVAPLTAGMELLGLLVVNDADDFTPNLEQMLYTLANIYGLGIRNALLFRRVEEMAKRDGLTGLYNHATFHQKLRSLIREASVKQMPLSLVMSDIDHFKKFNDEYGHQTGDDVLRELARLWKAAIPSSAVLARYGGEEFIAALPGVDECGAVELAEFIRETIEVHPFASNGHQINVTSSFGVAEITEGMRSADDVVRAADQCLYDAKNSGRNCVVRRSETSTMPLVESVG